MPLLTTTRGGGFRLFRLFGIDVYLHYLWILVAFFEIQSRSKDYSSIGWNAAEYLMMFAIVLMHEFGHALACRSVGGRADTIMLWPLGGVAFVQPPPRPGAWLWSIAAGPLVNVILAPIFLVGWLWAQQAGLSRDLVDFLWTALFIDVFLFVFNMLPIYPLDGGQIVQSILWFFIGQARSLLVASVIGLVGAGAGILLALATYAKHHNFWLILIAVYAAYRSWTTFKYARSMRAFDRLPRHNEFHCPACGKSPPAVPAWTCPDCGNPFDTFATGATCPQCGATFNETMCLSCRQRFPMSRWSRTGGFPVVTPTASAISPDWRTTNGANRM